jgi:hypothetical protein
MGLAAPPEGEGRLPSGKGVLADSLPVGAKGPLNPLGFAQPLGAFGPLNTQPFGLVGSKAPLTPGRSRLGLRPKTLTALLGGGALLPLNTQPFGLPPRRGGPEGGLRGASGGFGGHLWWGFAPSPFGVTAKLSGFTGAKLP